MRLFSHLPLKRKLVLMTMLTASLALLLASASFVTYEQFTARDRIVRETSSTAQMIGLSSSAGIAFNEPGSVEQCLQALSAQPGIVGACVYDHVGRLFAEYHRPKMDHPFRPPAAQENLHRFNGNRLELFQPINLAGEKVGTIYIEMDLSEMSQRVSRYLLIALAVLLTSTLLAFVLSTSLQKVISRPILDLVRTARFVAAEKNYSVRAVKSNDDELGVLIDGFNEMLEQIQRRDAELQAAQLELERRVEKRTRELQDEIGERRSAEEALRESQALYHSLVEQMPVGVFRKDREGNYVFVNSWFCRIKGVDGTLFLGKKPREVAEAERQSSSELNPTAELLATRGTDDHLRIMQTGQQIESEENCRGVWLHVIKSPVYGSDGAIVGSQGILMDVSQLKQAQDEAAREHSRLKFIFDSVPIGIAYNMTKPDGQALRLVNDTHLKISGLTRDEERQPDAWERASHPEDYQRQKALRQQLEEGKINRFSLDKRYLRPDGTTVWAMLSWQRRHYSDGTFEDVSTAVDITERKRTESELANERDLLNLLLNNVPDVIYFKDHESRFVRYSKSFACYFGLEDLDCLRGKSDADFFTEEHARPAREDELKILRTGQPIIGKLERETHRDGRVTWALTSKMPWRDHHGNIIGTFGTSKDITSMKEAEARIEEIHKQLLESSRQAGMAEVATSVLHNVGNVLTSVNTSASVITELTRSSKTGGVTRLAKLLEQHRDDLPAFLSRESQAVSVANYLNSLSRELASEQSTVLNELQELNKNIEHIKEIVAMQQSYARVSGLVELHSLQTLVEDSVRMHVGGLARHKVTVIRDYDEIPEVPLDKHKVLQILVNLISNAKYALSSSSADQRRLTLSLKRTGNDFVSIRISDNGVGIAPENLTRIFAHGFTTKKNGHGFGLHSGALAAREMGGSLSVESEGLGHGATFVLQLPLHPFGHEK